MPPADPTDQARFFYLTLLGIVIAARLLRWYRGRPRTALRHLAIWVLIVLALVLAFGSGDPVAARLLADRAQPRKAGGVTLGRARDATSTPRLAIHGTPPRGLVDAYPSRRIRPDRVGRLSVEGTNTGVAG